MSLEEAIVVVGQSRRRRFGKDKEKREASFITAASKRDAIGVKGKGLSREKGQKEERRSGCSFRRRRRRRYSYLKFGFPSSARSPAFVLREGGRIRAVDISLSFLSFYHDACFFFFLQTRMRGEKTTTKERRRLDIGIRRSFDRSIDRPSLSLSLVSQSAFFLGFVGRRGSSNKPF